VLQVAAPAGRGRAPRSSAAVLAGGFAVLILVGTGLLALPVASASRQWTPLGDALFTATSAVCVTGLVVLDTGTSWSAFGQAVLLLLVQIGGLGFMAGSTVVLLLVHREVTLRDRLVLQTELGASPGSAVRLARRVVAFTLVAEGAGAVLLAGRFLRERPLPEALWWGLFHAVAAFNNAGFDLVGGFRSLTPYAGDPTVLVPISLLVILGGISYTVVEDVVGTARATWAARSGWRSGVARLALDTKLVLAVSAGLLVAGTLAVLFTERANEATLGGLAPGPRLLNAYFLSVNARSAGFNAVPLDRLTEAGMLAVMGLMFVGGAAGSTAGGIKVQTLALLLVTVRAAMAGTPDVQVFRRRLPPDYAARAQALAFAALALVWGVSFGLTVTERAPYLDVLFETFSAFGTVGMSTGITPGVSPPGRLVLVATMLAGRLGPLTLALAFAARARPAAFRWAAEGVRLG
jgi:trk system potassium uptake protein TrkH